MAEPGRTHTKLVGAPDYDDPNFWDFRFATGRDVGEWLNSGEALLDVVLSDLERRPGFQDTPRVLHLGPGVSQLGMKLRDACMERQWMGNGIVNVDFSAEAVRLGQEAERHQAPHKAMHWLRADLLSWEHVSTLIPFAPFDVILDKSTSDAIATFSDRKISSEDDLSCICPTVRPFLSSEPTVTLSPVEALALHLVPLTQTNTTWIALSYSTLRFDSLPFLAKYWSLRSRTPLKATPGDVSSTAYTPEVFHWIYVMDRK
ncbi:hypothetical protein N7448_008932 [Penicillium atrosanguineum]|uniref:Uncharacterized protein n=1 Tax=Penicillium atrosanguineum TaxID=1132637 RepID=A0A9W9UBE3_9EURO|nr:carboxyphosphonoenolpyruvate mutase [Penicillium atrosanguineum]KAJ5128153.1 hypothetical protein N7448_008932 [Penicillium atrosanguineum]KAJ5313156.1 carboxyphosphonoenolpyruvate mutase [Penicillium atrosanguineum]KAJ5330261.1 hypothetical protein N7476_000044 [Penicillium atrosanguineum]